MKPEPDRRGAYAHFQPITTRWMDNDVYGHVNNVVYYSYFDTVVNTYLIREGVLDIDTGTTIGLVIETQCNYFSSLSFPDTVVAGLRVAKLGNSSVRYEVGLFRNDDDVAAAQGTLRARVRGSADAPPVALPPALRQALQALVVDRPER